MPLLKGNIHEIPKFVRCKNKEKYAPKKKQTHKTIFTWFGNLSTSIELQ